MAKKKQPKYEKSYAERSAAYHAKQPAKPAPKPAAKPAAAPKASTAPTTYADGARPVYNAATGRFDIVRPDGSVIQGATAFANGTGIGYRAPVEKLTDLPAGSYDPGLLYQSQNANLGQFYNAQDFQTAWAGYNADSPEVPPADLASSGRAVQDYWTGRGTLAQALERARQDYSTATDTLGRNYRTLGNNQLQSINQRGLLSGGALAQALAKRTENQGREQTGLDLSWKRYGEDNQSSVNELTTGYRRSFADGSLTLSRGGESNALYQAGLSGSASAQAQQSGLLVDNPNYQTHNGVLYQVTPAGQRVPVANTSKKKRPKDKSLHPGSYPGFSGSRPVYTGSGNPYATYPNI